MTMIQQQLQSVFPTLPQEIKDLLMSLDLNDKVGKVAESHGCDETQTGLLIRLTVRLLSGLIPATQFVSLITEELDISHDESAFIAQEINRDIFNPVKDALKSVHAVGSSVTPGGTNIEKPIGTAPTVLKPLLKPDLSALSSSVTPSSVPSEAASVLFPQPTPPMQAPIVSPQVTAQPKPLPTFSVTQALGNIPSTGSSQSTALPAEMPKAHVGTIAASASTEQTGNILEDKLAGTFRMKTDTAKSVGIPQADAMNPKQVIPPPPRATTQAPPTQEKSALAKALDPYRESPL